jgi:hypothetical protein
LRRKQPTLTKYLLILPWLIVFLSGVSFAADYDATGTWQLTTSDNWMDPGSTGCSPEDSYTAYATITQNGDSVTILTLGATYTGPVVGSTYTASATYQKEGAQAANTLTFTLRSDASGSGTTVWSLGMGAYSCSGGANLTLSKTEADGYSSEYTGWWYFPDKDNGNGISLEVQNGALYMAWYTYDESGRPVWYTSGNIMSDAESYSGDLRVWTGWPLGTTPSTFRSSVAGSIQITFFTSDYALVDWTVGEKSGWSFITKFMDFMAPGVRDPRDLHGWWKAPEADGMGLFMEAQGGGMYIGWYHYREDGSPRWWVSDNVFPIGSSTYTGDLSEWTNGSCIGCSETKPDPPSGMGKITINFLSESRAVLTWDGGQLNLERFIFYNMQ